MNGLTTSLAAVLTVVLTFNGSPLLAGHAENNGGGVMVCPGQPDGVQTLDLWEAKAIYGQQMTYTNDEPTRAVIQRELAAALERVKAGPIFKERLRSAIRYMDEQVFDRPQRLPPDVLIAPPLDGGNGFMGRNCELKGAILYDNFAGRLFLDEDLFAAMSTTDRAALIMHEAVYKVFRDSFGADTSIGTRRFVSCLFSTDQCPELDPKYGVNGQLFNKRCVTKGITPITGLPAYEFYMQHSRSTNEWQSMAWRFKVAGGVPVPAVAEGHTFATKVKMDLDSFSQGDFTYHLLKGTLGARQIQVTSAYGQTMVLDVGGGPNSDSPMTIDGNVVGCTGSDLE